MPVKAYRGHLSSTPDGSPQAHSSGLSLSSSIVFSGAYIRHVGTAPVVEDQQLFKYNFGNTNWPIWFMMYLFVRHEMLFRR